VIYLDNAATSYKKPDGVIAALADALQHLGNGARGVHGASLDSARTVYEAREKIADFFGCPSASHVVFTQNATEALNTALCGLFSPGDTVISTDLEHNSVLRPLYRLQKEAGVDVRFVSADKYGKIDIDAFLSHITPKTKAIVTTHASNLTGNVLDIARIGQIAKAHGLFYIVDASQTAGTLPIHMPTQHIDVLCFTGHKGLLGPQGTGGLCLSEGVAIRPLKVGGTGIHSFLETQPPELPEALEAGTLNGHGIAGLSAAIDYIKATGLEKIHQHEMDLMHQFYNGVKRLDGVTVYGDFSGDRAPIVTLNIRDYDSGMIADELSENYDIAVRAGAHCAPRMHLALGTQKQGAVRFSFGWFNTKDEVSVAINAIKEIASE